MKSVLFAICFLSLMGCSTVQKMTNINLRMSNETTASAPEIGEIEKCETLVKRGDGSLDCDLITYKTASETKAIVAACMKKAKKKSDCETVFGQTILSRLEYAYPKADFAKADLWCRSEPVICDLSELKGVAEYEIKLRDSHFDALDEDEARAEKVAASERRARASAALMALSQSMKQTQPRITTCNSSQLFGTVTTNCQTTP